MLNAISANKDLMVTVITWLKLLLIGIIFYDLFLIYLGKPKGDIKLDWRSSPYQELRVSLMYIIVVPVTFIFLFIMESTPKGMEFTPPLSRAATIFILVGWLFILVVPKRYAVTDKGILVKGTFYTWDYIKTAELQKGLSQVQIIKKNPLMPPSIMLCKDAEEVHKAIMDAMEARDKSVKIFRPRTTIIRQPSDSIRKKAVKKVKKAGSPHKKRTKRPVKKAQATEDVPVTENNEEEEETEDDNNDK